MKILICDDEIFVREETVETVTGAFPEAECLTQVMLVMRLNM